MIEKEVILQNKLGLHARPAALFVKAASKFKSEIKVQKEDLIVDGKSIMGLMMLAAESGSKLTLQINGEDENEAMNELIELFKEKFYEE